MSLKIKHLKTISEIFNKYKNFIFDCDGVLWQHGKVLKEAINTINTLNANNKTIFYLTNKNSITKQDLYKQLSDSGIKHIKYENVYSSSYLTGKYIKEKFPHIKKIYLIGRESLKNQLEQFGLEVSGGPEDDEKKISKSEIKNLILDKELDAVVCGSDDQINFYKILYASNVAFNTKLFFGTNYDNYTKYKGIIVPEAYSYISAIESASDVKATIVAKPNKEILSIMFGNFEKMNREEVIRDTLMIGDRVRSDIGFANNCGIDSLLVLTGVTNITDIDESDENYSRNNFNLRPTYILNDLNM